MPTPTTRELEQPDSNYNFFSKPLPATVASSFPTRKDKVLLFFLPWQAFYTRTAAA